ncbi:autophagy- protein 2 [Allomyces arbusculus]|nr:autophagy- protein 2 [Allomyces arbusculus]
MWSTFSAFGLPAALQKRLVKFLLKRTLGKFLQHDLNLAQVDVSMGTTGTLILRDLHLNVDAVNALIEDEPVMAVAGSIATVRVVVPWMDLGGSSCEMEFDGVELCLAPKTVSGSASSTPAASYLEEMANSVYLANEFLRRQDEESDDDDGISVAGSKRDATQPAFTVVNAPTSVPDPASGRLEGIQLLAQVIDKILANLRVTVRNLVVQVDIAPSLPVLQLLVPELTMAEGPPSFFAPSKTVTVPAFSVQMRAPFDPATPRPPSPSETLPLLWCPHPLTAELSLGGRGIAMHVTMDELVAVMWPSDLANLMQMADVLQQSARRPGGSKGFPMRSPPVGVSWDVDSDSDDAAPATSSSSRRFAPASTAPVSDDEFLTDDDDDEDHFHSVQQNTVFYSAVHESVLLPPRSAESGVTATIGRVTCIIALADPTPTCPRALASLDENGAPHVRILLNHVALKPTMDVEVKDVTVFEFQRGKPPNSVVTVPNAQYVAAGRCLKIPRVAITADPGLPDRLQPLLAALDAAKVTTPPSTPPTRTPPNRTPPRRPTVAPAPPPPPRIGFAIEVEEVGVTLQVTPDLALAVTVEGLSISPALAGQIRAFSVRLDGRTLVSSTKPHSFQVGSRISLRGLPPHLARAGAGKRHLAWRAGPIECTLTQHDLVRLTAAAAAMAVARETAAAATAAPRPGKTPESPFLVAVQVDGVTVRLPELNFTFKAGKVRLTLIDGEYHVSVRDLVARHGPRILVHRDRLSRDGAIIASSRGPVHHVVVSALHVDVSPECAKFGQELGKFMAQLGSTERPPLDIMVHLSFRNVVFALPTDSLGFPARLTIESADGQWQPDRIIATLHYATFLLDNEQVATCESLELLFTEATPTEPLRIWIHHPSIEVTLFPHTIPRLMDLAAWAQESMVPVVAPRRPPASSPTSDTLSPPSSSMPTSPVAARGLLDSLDDDAFSNKLKPVNYDLSNLSISVVEDFAAFEEELEQTVMLDTDMTSSSDDSSSAASSVAALEIVDDHFADLDVRSLEAHRAANSASTATPFASTFLCEEVKLVVHLKMLAPVVMGGSGAADREFMSIIAVHAHGCQIEHSVFRPGGDFMASTKLAVREIEVFDLVATSNWNKLLSAYRVPGRPLAAPAKIPFIRADILTVARSEVRVKVRVQPIKVHLDQDALDALVDFYAAMDLPVVVPDEGDEAGVAPAPPVGPKPGDLFFQRVEVYPIQLRLDYKPKSMDLGDLKRGNFVQLLNFFHLEGAEMNLRQVTVTGARGVSELVEALLSCWLPHVKNTQLPNMVSGVGPLRSLVNIGTGVADLILLPVEQYRKDGRVIKGLQKGAHNFVKTAAVETLHLGTKVAVGTHALLQKAEELMAPSPPPASAPVSPHRAPTAGATVPGGGSKYAHQPRNAKEGIELALRSLSRNVSEAVQVIAMPIETMERDGATGTMRAVIRAVPVAVLKPMLGATDAMSKALMGIRNSVDPAKELELQDKYKSV